jgi:hypothetical protein
MSEIGGVPPQNSLILTIPRARRSTTRSPHAPHDRAKRREGAPHRIPFLLFGHSTRRRSCSEDSYPYAELKEALNAIPTDVHVVMLDSCYSGNFVGRRGLAPKALLDRRLHRRPGARLPLVELGARGIAGTDRIQASYFTHALVSGLRRAADASGDGKVSLNELYHYASTRPCPKRNAPRSAPSTPHIHNLVGSGAPRPHRHHRRRFRLVIPKENEGRYFIRAEDARWSPRHK